MTALVLPPGMKAANANAAPCAATHTRILACAPLTTLLRGFASVVVLMLMFLKRGHLDESLGNWRMGVMVAAFVMSVTTIFDLLLAVRWYTLAHYHPDAPRNAAKWAAKKSKVKTSGGGSAKKSK